MVMFLSYIIAIVITLALAIILYPISAVFFIVAKVGYVLGILADFIFTHTNSGIKKLWSDIKHTRVIRDEPINTDNSTIFEKNPVFIENNTKE